MNASLNASRRRGLVVTRGLLVALGSMLVGACADGDDGRPAAPTSASPTTTSSTAQTQPERDPFANFVATAKGDSIEVFDEPGADVSRVLTKADAVSDPKTPIVFLVESRRDDWHHVYLPVRPNGSTGWVRDDAVTISQHRFRVVVELGAKHLRVLDGDDVVLETAVGVGRRDRPTPGGVYYIKELLRPPDPDGVYGSYAYGLSGFSNVLESFAGGEAVIGLHGTNEPELIGQDVSSGCIRMANPVIERLVEEIGLPLGTPVEIRS